MGRRWEHKKEVCNVLILRLCRADLDELCLFWSGEFEENFPQISQQILPANFVREFFGIVSPGLRPPKIFTPKIVGILLSTQRIFKVILKK